MAARCQLIVNADDFGQSPGINRGILSAHDEGIITSASLMVRWPASSDAAREARGRPRLSVGLHVDLGEWRHDGNDWRPVYEVVRLDDTDAAPMEIFRQLEAFRRLVGRDPTHMDSHQHVHRREPIRSVLVALASELDIPLRHFSPDVRYCGEFYGQDEGGVTRTGALTVEHFVSLLTSLPSGITELACHPAAVADLPTMYGKERLIELSVLCDARVKQTIASLGIELRSFNGLGTPVVERSVSEVAL